MSDVTAHWNADVNGVNWVRYRADNDLTAINIGSQTAYQVKDPAVLYAPNNTAVVIQSGGTFHMEDTAIVDSKGGIVSNGGTVELKDSYIIGDSESSNRAIFIKDGSLGIDGGAIAENKIWGNNPGSAIYADNCEVDLDGNVKIVNNSCYNLNEKFGGAISLQGHSLMTVNQAKISYNLLNLGNEDWTGGAGIGVGGNSELTLNHGADISYNKSQKLGGGICLASAHFYKSDDPNKKEVNTEADYNQATKLYMHAGASISHNIAVDREGGGLALAADHWNYAYLYGGTFEENRTYTPQDWGGGGIFVGAYSYMILPNGASVYSNTADGYGGGIAGCSTGKLFIDEKVMMMGNKGYGNKWTGDASLKDEPKFASDPKFKEYGGANDFFGCLKSQVAGTLFGSEDTGAGWSGSADEKQLTNINVGTVTANTLLGLSSNRNVKDYLAESSPTLNHGIIVKNNHSSIHGGGILINGFMISSDVQNLYTGDTLQIQTKKELIGLTSSNSLPLTEGEFSFEVLKDDLSTVISSGTNTKEGVIQFSPEISFTDVANSSYEDFYVREVKGNKDNVDYDSTIYQLHVSLSSMLKDSFVVRERDENGQDKLVTYNWYEISVTGISVSKGSIQSDGNGLRFTASESLGTFQVTGENHQKIVNLATDKKAIFTNKKIEKTRVTVEKKWGDGAENHNADSIQVQLYRKHSGEDDNSLVLVSGKDQLILNAENGWQGEWNELPTEDNQGIFEYQVREINPSPLYTPSYQYEMNISGEQKTVGKTGDLWVRIENSESLDPSKQYLLIADDGTVLTVSETSYSWIPISISEKSVELKSGNTQLAQDNKQFGYLSNSVPANSLFKVANYGIDNIDQSQGRALYLDEGKSLEQSKFLNMSNGNINIFGTHNHWTSGSTVAADNQKVRFKIRGQSQYCYLAYDAEQKIFKPVNNKSDANVRIYKLENDREYWASEMIPSYTYAATITNTLNEDAQYQLNIHKKDADLDDDRGHGLSGAQFELYQGNKRLSWQKADSDNTFTLQESGDLTVFTTDNDGNVHLNGLKAGSYTLKEVKAPDGYYFETPDTSIVISKEALENSSSLIINAVISNKKQIFELPETGGSGTTRFITTGSSAIILSTALYGYSRKKRRKEGETDE